MGKGRAPCCDKSKVKRGPWSPAEDFKLITFIQNHGHANWRSLPAQAGLLRCGKSCRLRWINYLRPDLKRGNITPEEEENIIKLHETHGNKWSKIASSFPGRTDNEIKNIWNTHIAKKLGIKCVRKHAYRRKKSNKSSQDSISSSSRSSVLQNDDIDGEKKINTSLSNIKVLDRTTSAEMQGFREKLREEDEQGESPTRSLISCLSNVVTSEEHGHGWMDTSFNMSLEAMDVDVPVASNDQSFQKPHNFEESDFWDALELENLCPLQCFENEKTALMSNASEDSTTSSDSGNKQPDTSNVEPYSWVRYLEIELGLDA